MRATALREAKEEIGLAPSDVEVVARLEGIATVASRFTIAPFVGFLPPRPLLTPDPREVVRVFDVPLSALMAEGVYREERWDTWMADLDVHFYELEDETVWGATARILTSFLAHLIADRAPGEAVAPARVLRGELPQPLPQGVVAVAAATTIVALG